MSMVSVIGIILGSPYTYVSSHLTEHYVPGISFSPVHLNLFHPHSYKVGTIVILLDFMELRHTKP